MQIWDLGLVYHGRASFYFIIDIYSHDVPLALVPDVIESHAIPLRVENIEILFFTSLGHFDFWTRRWRTKNIFNINKVCRNLRYAYILGFLEDKLPKFIHVIIKMKVVWAVFCNNLFSFRERFSG